MPRSPRHRASCIAAYVPVGAYLAFVPVRFGGGEHGAFGDLFAVSALALSGPFGPFCCVLGVLPERSIPFVAFALLLVPYLMIARHDLGTMPRQWFLALSSTWTGFCAWMLMTSMPST